MTTYKTPGVYTEEVASLSPSVAEGGTAIPAFLGYTEKTGTRNELVYTPTRIANMLEYEQLFGGAASALFAVHTYEGGISTADPEAYGGLHFMLYYQLKMYFKNGGGPCYIVSLGDYETMPEVSHFERGLQELERHDEPTLLILTDAVQLDGYYSLCQAALAQCARLKNRFTIIDIPYIEEDWEEGSEHIEDPIAHFRNSIGMNHLDYGAAYYPYLYTSEAYQYQDKDVLISTSTQSNYTEIGGLHVSYTGDFIELFPAVNIVLLEDTPIGKEHIDFHIDPEDLRLTISVPDGAGSTPGGASPAQIRDRWDEWKQEHPTWNFGIELVGFSGRIDAPVEAIMEPASYLLYSLDDIEESNTALYNTIKANLTKERVILPPSGTIAGIYAKTDRERGVWKAPANASLTGVLAPIYKIAAQEQEALNVDPGSGKSINAIRTFHGKGTLVWGARTLAGNDNEWRYVPVRRLFITIESAVKKAAAFAVFESNDIITWLKVRSMIESYLTGLWEQGAMAGTTEQEAFYVEVGLGTSMTEQDVLEGRMIVEIGIAAARPAEFIVLRFTHQLQENR